MAGLYQFLQTQLLKKVLHENNKTIYLYDDTVVTSFFIKGFLKPHNAYKVTILRDITTEESLLNTILDISAGTVVGKIFQIARKLLSGQVYNNLFIFEISDQNIGFIQKAAKIIPPDLFFTTGDSVTIAKGKNFSKILEKIGIKKRTFPLFIHEHYLKYITTNMESHVRILGLPQSFVALPMSKTLETRYEYKYNTKMYELVVGNAILTSAESTAVEIATKTTEFLELDIETSYTAFDAYSDLQDACATLTRNDKSPYVITIPALYSRYQLEMLFTLINSQAKKVVGIVMSNELGELPLYKMHYDKLLFCGSAVQNTANLAKNHGYKPGKNAFWFESESQMLLHKKSLLPYYGIVIVYGATPSFASSLIEQA